MFKPIVVSNNDDAIMRTNNRSNFSETYPSRLFRKDQIEPLSVSNNRTVGLFDSYNYRCYEVDNDQLIRHPVERFALTGAYMCCLSVYGHSCQYETCSIGGIKFLIYLPLHISSGARAGGVMSTNI